MENTLQKFRDFITESKAQCSREIDRAETYLDHTSVCGRLTDLKTVERFVDEFIEGELQDERDKRDDQD